MTRSLFRGRAHGPPGISAALPPVCIGDMALIGRLHPLLLHFPIGLVLIAAAAEVAAMTTGLWDWRAVAVANVRAGAVSARRCFLKRRVRITARSIP
jgi:Predicted membrane protein (DUF2231)